MMWQGEQFVGGKTTAGNVQRYLKLWKSRDYPDDIPDEIPEQLAKEKLAPSWKAIACAILKNDMLLTSLGFTTGRESLCGRLKSNLEKQQHTGKTQQTLF
jgi:predicted phosphoadenosine phosphosulfate sulfurtransferase